MPTPRRFDDGLMQPPHPSPEADAALLARVRDWCEAGALPRATLPFAAARIAPHDGLDAVACDLDGSHALARLGRWRGLAWRLRVLGNDHRGSRPPRREDPWDCGWWREGALAEAAAFRPRRATLLLVRDPASATADSLRAALEANRAAFAKPVRLLFVTRGRPAVPAI